jgi:microcystin-dependent protein
MSTLYTRFFSALARYNATEAISDVDIDGDFDGITAALNRKCLVSGSAPSSPVNGDTWYDTTAKQLKVYRVSQWVGVSFNYIGTSAPSVPQNGDLFTDTSAYTLSVYLNSAWVTIVGVPAGVYIPYGGSSAPSGWLLCYGQAVSRTTYAALFTAIGTAYGSGDGSTTFNVPDLRGRLPAGLDNMGGSSADRITNSAADSTGGTYGTETHTLTTTEMPSHKHTYVVRAAAGGGSDAYYGDSTPTKSADTTDTGGGQPHNNVQPSIFSNYIIKT